LVSHAGWNPRKADVVVKAASATSALNLTLSTGSRIAQPLGARGLDDAEKVFMPCAVASGSPVHRRNVPWAAAHSGRLNREAGSGAATHEVIQPVDREVNPRVDLLKMDIRRSEFVLLEQPKWLTRMHRAHGAVEPIHSGLENARFPLSLRRQQSATGRADCRL